MRILYIIESLKAGGKERRLVELVKRVSKINKVELIILSQNIHFTDLLNLNIKIHYLRRNLLKDFLLLFKFYFIVKNFKPSIIHSWDNIASIHFGPISKILKIPFVNSMITTAPQKMNFLSKRYLSNVISFPFSDIILCNSKAGAKSFRTPNNKTHIIYNGFDLGRIKKIKNKVHIQNKYQLNNFLVVGMVANFTEKKDYKTFIDAAKIVINRVINVKFIAIGHGPNLSKMKNYLPNELKNNFLFLGRVDDVDSIVNCFTVGVLSTYSEGISNAVIEYMAFGKPVVVTDGGGTNELVLDKINGYLSKIRDSGDLAEKIISILNDSKKIEQMGNSSQKRISTLFSVEKMAQETEELYKSLII